MTGADLEHQLRIGAPGQNKGVRELNYPLPLEWVDVIIIISPGSQRRAGGALQICGRSGGVDFIGQVASLPIQRRKGDTSRCNWCLGTRRDGQREYTHNRDCEGAA